VKEVLTVLSLKSVPVIVTVYVVLAATVQLTGRDINLLVTSKVAQVGRPEAA
jgi:hypothetical protein